MSTYCFARIKEECSDEFYFTICSSMEQAVEMGGKSLQAIYPIHGLDRLTSGQEEMLDVLLKMDGVNDRPVFEDLLTHIFASGYYASKSGMEGISGIN